MIFPFDMKDETRAQMIKQAGIARHGSEKKWRAYQSNAARKATYNRNKPQGFAHMKIHAPDRLKDISIKGGKHEPTKQTQGLVE